MLQYYFGCRVHIITFKLASFFQFSMQFDLIIEYDFTLYLVKLCTTVLLNFWQKVHNCTCVIFKTNLPLSNRTVHCSL